VDRIIEQIFTRLQKHLDPLRTLGIAEMVQDEEVSGEDEEEEDEPRVNIPL
jgi:hypothetical protein